MSAAAQAAVADAVADAAEEASAFAHPPVAPDATGSYGPHPDQVVDFHLPPSDAASAPAPLVVLFHGGAWRSPYDRLHISPLAAFLAGRGLAVASVEYRRGPASEARTPGTGAAPRPRAGRWPETFDDLAAAVDAVPRLVAELGLTGVDAGRMVLCGHSAGGHAALWAAARHVLPADAPWRAPAAAPAVRGVVALAPIADFAVARELGVCSDAVDELLDGEAALPRRLPYADPAALLPTGVPTTIVQGARDADVPARVAEAFAAAAERAGQPVRLTLLADVGHFPPIDPATAAARTVADEIEGIVRRYAPGA
ncbi:alpha/beta hydrolase [Streptomyces sp. LX-29]|uniref:alpha/beta hydrolase n=1 Tax=Streptomyces sp. LX-29 TaxID=2900152 RepID=UPI00240DED4A|nr:alpha/beta hydrolase [Streptomyces sp. LX-29]WFB11694.1 alpha/beta hydrolase [Streptomyces sp. LX-29]